MKITFPLFLVLLLASGGAEDRGSAGAAAPACGPDDVRFDVKTARSEHPLAMPAPGRALVYFLQDEPYFLPRPRPSARFAVDGSWMGATQSHAYFYVSVDPGEHHLCASWQPSQNFPVVERSAAHFTAEAGRSYFFVIHDRTADYGPTGVLLAVLDSDEAQLLISKFGYSSSHPKR